MNLKKLVNDKSLWDNFVEYLDHNIEKQHRAMEQTEDNIILYRSQGAIAALRRLKYLRDEMNNA
jgi:hypothetical protein|tara:strand:- start:508 stop:699 length:192 start_codon:yes stop_codon:yes gene_type:complete